jgi:hypothetical protein
MVIRIANEVWDYSDLEKEFLFFNIFSIYRRVYKLVFFLVPKLSKL